jgi:hypothetical protein
MSNLKYTSDKFDSCLNTYRETFTNQNNIPSDTSGSLQQYDNTVILPLDFSLEMDGISGIIPNSAFEIPPDVLPKTVVKSAVDEDSTSSSTGSPPSKKSK